jgi:hypothetical protein
MTIMFRQGFRNKGNTLCAEYSYNKNLNKFYEGSAHDFLIYHEPNSLHIKKFSSYLNNATKYVHTNETALTFWFYIIYMFKKLCASIEMMY